MYLSHYNLIEKPFQITTDPKFLWLGEKHQEALAMLRYGVLDNKGFLLLTGDVGTGKTTLINALLRDLDSNTIVATVVDPNLEKLEFFNFFARAFEIEGKFTKKVDFLTHFSHFLNNAYLTNKKVLLIIDEAQKLSTELLEEIRLLSNIEKEDTKLLNIFFVGQNEFKKTLMEKGCRAIRQRITMTYQINPLTESETTEYIKCRLKVAGTDKEIFNKKAIRQIYAFSRGYPRLINIMCDHALLTGYVRGLKTINPAIIKECSQELIVPGETAPTLLQWEPRTGKQENKPLRRGALWACLLLLVALNVYLFNALGSNDYIQNLKNYYGQKFSRSEGSSSRYLPGKIRVPESQLPLMSRPVSRADARDGGIPPLAGNVNREESLADANRPQVYQPSVPVLQGPPADTFVPEKEISDAVKRSSINEGEESLLSADLKLIIPFKYDTNEMPQIGYDTLDRLAGVMWQNLDIDVIVKGYTDTSGTYHYNKKLSKMRANTVKSYLVAKGISPMRIQTIGIGEENPLKPNTTAAGRRANRRAEIELQPAGEW